MTSPAISLPPDATGVQALRLMADNRVSTIIIAEKDRPVGVLAQTGTPNDRAIFVNMEGFYRLHTKAEEGSGSAHNDEVGAGNCRRRSGRRCATARPGGHNAADGSAVRLEDLENALVPVIPSRIGNSLPWIRIDGMIQLGSSLREQPFAGCPFTETISAMPYDCAKFRGCADIVVLLGSIASFE